MNAVATSRNNPRLKKIVQAAKKTKRPKKSAKKDISDSYNRFKEFNGRQYTGMSIGRSHKWYYDKGEWKETKITPDLWGIFYSVTKRRAGKAPPGSGVPVGTGYHWYIVAHQNVKKLNADDYTTTLSGLKFKVAHKRADKDQWSAKTTMQRKQLIKFLKQMVHQLENEVIPLKFEFGGKTYNGEGVPIAGTCHDGVCFELDITLNNEHLGIIKSRKSGWKMDSIQDQKLVDAIGEEIILYYE